MHTKNVGSKNNFVSKRFQVKKYYWSLTVDTEDQVLFPSVLSQYCLTLCVRVVIFLIVRQYLIRIQSLSYQSIVILSLYWSPGHTL